MKIKAILWAYFIIGGGNLISQILETAVLCRFTKPLLMPVLFYYVYETSKGRVTLRVLFLGLAILLSWIGDLALMYKGYSYFLTGIGFLFLAKIDYACLLYRSTARSPVFNIFKVLPYTIICLAVFSVFLTSGDERYAVPIFIDGMALSVMAGMARLRKSNTNRESYQQTLYGSISFLIFASLVALDWFYQPMLLSGLWIMATYIPAQFLMVNGIMKHIEPF